MSFSLYLPNRPEIRLPTKSPSRSRDNAGEIASTERDRLTTSLSFPLFRAGMRRKAVQLPPYDSPSVSGNDRVLPEPIARPVVRNRRAKQKLEAPSDEVATVTR